MNIIKFLTANDIYYTDSGNNVKQGNVNIHCCFCGSDDPSEHLGIALQSPHVWGCWRNQKHRGKNIIDLIVKLTNYSWSEAKAIAEEDKSLLEDSEVSMKIKDIFSDKQVVEEKKGVKHLEFPSSFKDIVPEGLYTRFGSYVYSRGFDSVDTARLIQYYNLKGCLVGDYVYRLIIPVYYGNQLVTWTGRSIGNSELRYLDLSPDKSVIALKETLLDYDNLLEKGGRRLYVVEGAFDVFPIFLWGDEDVEATCTFTVNMSNQQKYLLSMLSKRFNEIVFLPDSEFEMNAWELKNDLAYIKNIRVQMLPLNVDDPGDLSGRQIRSLVNN